MLKIEPAEKSEVTRIKCPHCGERVSRVGIEKGTKNEGITFRCRRCGMLWKVRTE